MPNLPTRTIRIHRRPDGKFECRNGSASDSPLGVDSDLNVAIGTAHREATLISNAQRCRVVIEVQQLNGKFKRTFPAVKPK